jgi:signal transduction histidine kinase
LVTALINLAVNAVDAMPDGGELTLSVTAQYRPKPSHAVDGRTLSPGDYAVFGVGDTGHGIPQELMSRVVDPFFSTKPVGKGSGLGLSMVVGLAHSLDGGVVIQSDPSGTQVSLLVPVAGQAEAEALLMMPQAAQ